MERLTVVEICAGAGGQALGLHHAGFDHVLAVEIDRNAAATLRANSEWPVVEGDVADQNVWNPSDYKGVTLLAGGVPCPPFSSAGKQLGSNDERDLFAWAVEQVEKVQPRAVLLENVRGLSATRFAAYRQRILDRLSALGYVAEWRLLQAADFGVAQLRPRFVLIALRPEDASYFHWPSPNETRVSVGDALGQLMAENGWPHVKAWREMANGIGPTLVGGSKKHGGADLGPTRAKLAWRALAVDGRGVADSAPGPDWPHPADRPPRLTIPMVARLQGWTDHDPWVFQGSKTSQYRQIGNAFPPPVARAIGASIASALRHEGVARDLPDTESTTHDPVYQRLVSGDDFVSSAALLRVMKAGSTQAHLEDKMRQILLDFELEVEVTPSGARYKLGAFRGFTGQTDHQRHEFFTKHRSRVS